MSRIDQLQEIVQSYFKNVIGLPCPDFRANLLALEESTSVSDRNESIILYVPKLLDFVERHNKQDKEKDIAEIVNNINRLLN